MAKKCTAVEIFKPGTSCAVCYMNEVEETRLGPIYQYGSTFAHYFCLLLSSEIKQKGRDDQGILGFLLRDIKNEAKRGKTQECSYCGENGATINCAHRCCKIKFHLSCGTKKGSMHLFYDSFNSYCVNHRRYQTITKKEKALIGSDPECVMCASKIDMKNKCDFIWPTCCKSMPSHRECIQKYAFNAGTYHFNCTFCRDKESYLTLCRTLGIYIPQRDASWELEPSAFAELESEDYCNADNCICPKGRRQNSARSKNWKIVKCSYCRSTGTHLRCAPVPISDINAWICNACEGVSVSKKDEVASRGELLCTKEPRELLPSHPLRLANGSQPGVKPKKQDNSYEPKPSTSFAPDDEAAIEDGQKILHVFSIENTIAKENSSKNDKVLLAGEVPTSKDIIDKDENEIIIISDDDVEFVGETVVKRPKKHRRDKVLLAGEVPTSKDIIDKDENEIIIISDDDVEFVETVAKRPKKHRRKQPPTSKRPSMERTNFGGLNG